MKKSFDHYHRPSKAGFEKLWKEGLFVFDTNVLLQLYELPKSLREVYFSAIGKLKNRWIPHQVGLEFHKNRLSRINQAQKNSEEKLKEVNAIKEMMEKLDLSQLSPESSDKILSIKEKIASSLDELCLIIEDAKKDLPDISLDDPIAEKISNLFNEKIGPPPKDQEALEKIFKDGETRFQREIPPGFRDEKAKKDGVFHHNDLDYQSKFGDLILWEQLIEFAKDKKHKYIVLITNDQKEDWWAKEKGRTLGPLPSLILEIKTKAEVDIFWMYQAKNFIQKAQEHFKNVASDEDVEKIQKFSIQNSQPDTLLPLEDSITHVNEEPQTSDFLRKLTSLLLADSEYKWNNNPPILPNRPLQKIPVVSVEQSPDPTSSSVYHSGLLTIKVLRDTAMATGTGKFFPRMENVPNVKVELLQMPLDNIPIWFTAGTGTAIDFNINMRSRDRSVRLPAGEYVFFYEAKCAGIFNNQTVLGSD